MDLMLMATIDDMKMHVLNRIEEMEKKLDQILSFVENIENEAKNDQTD